MRTMPFTPPTLIAGVELLEGHSQGRFNQMVLRPKTPRRPFDASWNW